MRLPIRRSRPTVWLVCLLITAASGGAQTHLPDLPVFTDGLNGDFSDWTWLPHDLTNTSPVHSGDFSIKVSPPANPAGWPVLGFRHRDLDTAAYASIAFWANGGEQGGQLLQICSILGTNPQAFYELSPLPTNAWRRFVVPLALLGAQERTNFAGFWFQMQGAGQTNPFFLDDIELAGAPVAAPVPPTASVAAAGAPPARVADRGWSAAVWCIAAALIVITALLGWLVVLLWRSGLGTSQALLPMSLPTLTQITQYSDAGGGMAAGQRDPAVEALADPSAGMLREKLAAELAAFAKQSLVQGLYSQRGKLLETQEQARMELAELEARLAALHLPLQERVRAYEARIAELEKQLKTRDEEMRNIIHATLLLVQERLEKAKEETIPGRFN